MSLSKLTSSAWQSQLRAGTGFDGDLKHSSLKLPLTQLTYIAAPDVLKIPTLFYKRKEKSYAENWKSHEWLAALKARLTFALLLYDPS